MDTAGSGERSPAGGGRGRSKLTSVVSPLGTQTLRSTSPDSPLRVGSVLVSAELPATGTILFSSTVPGFRGVAGVGAAVSTTRFFVPVQRDPFAGTDSGLAIANATGAAVSVTLTLRNESGALLGTRALSLPPHGQTAAFLVQLFPTSDIVTLSLRGTITAASSGEVAAIALLFTGNEFATLPVTRY